MNTFASHCRCSQFTLTTHLCLPSLSGNLPSPSDLFTCVSKTCCHMSLSSVRISSNTAGVALSGGHVSVPSPPWCLSPWATLEMEWLQCGSRTGGFKSLRDTGLRWETWNVECTGYDGLIIFFNLKRTNVMGSHTFCPSWYWGARERAGGNKLLSILRHALPPEVLLEKEMSPMATMMTG